MSVEEIYADPKLTDDAIDAIFSASLKPRPSTMLYDKMGEIGLQARHRLLDVGCRDARHTAVLVQRFGCQAVGVDPVDDHINRALVTINEQQLTGRLTVHKGRIEALPLHSASIDYVWSRDMLNLVPDLRNGLQECVRVLRAGGRMLVYQTFATNLLEPSEAIRLYMPMAVVAANMSHDYFEEIARRVGFRIREKDLVGSEWREHWEEDGSRRTSAQLLRLARLRRRREEYIAKVGRTVYEVELADCYWGVYQMLGKLMPTIYVLEKPESRK
ncbi:MAG: class I SAM-dependent methyltransferase [Caldilineaceae bacterium]